MTKLILVLPELLVQPELLVLRALPAVLVVLVVLLVTLPTPLESLVPLFIVLAVLVILTALVVLVVLALHYTTSVNGPVSTSESFLWNVIHDPYTNGLPCYLLLSDGNLHMLEELVFLY